MRFSLLVIVSFALLLSGCGSGEEARRKTRARGARIGIVMQYYLAQNNERYPATLEDLKPLFKSDRDFKVAMTHPRTGESPAWEYVRPGETSKEVKDFAKTAVIYEIVGGKRVEGGFIGYADGHMEPELGSPLTPEDMKLPE